MIAPRPLALPFDIELALPGAKSHANRALVAACLAHGRTVLRGATACDDVVLMVENLARLGFAVRWRERASGVVEVDGGVPRGPGGAAELYCGNAGAPARFLCALACVVPGSWTLTGDARLRERPMGPLLAALRRLGADVRGDGMPLAIRGGSLRGGRVVLDARLSSQFASALKLVAPVLDGGIEVACDGPVASAPYLALTDRVIADFGAAAGAGYRARDDYAIEGDWSAAGAFLVLAELTGSRFTGTNLSAASAQPDRRLPELIAALRGAGDREVAFGDVPDQLGNLAVLAARREGGTRFVGGAHLRHKESDRLAVLARELGRAGVAIEARADGVEVRGGTRWRGATLDPCGDHRMAIAFAVLASLGAPIEIRDPGCVAKSYPGFFADLARLHDAPRCIALVGMRGAGKSTLAGGLAAALGLERADTDATFAALHGDLGSFVARHGWPAFRREEERLVREALVPGRVVALGGGAVTSAATRSLLRARARVVFVDEAPEVLQWRLAAGGPARPSLTGLPAEAEVAAVLAERLPLYREVADVTLPRGLAPDELVRAAAAALRPGS